MISASDARSKINNSITEAAIGQWLLIEKKINQAIEENKYSVTIDGYIIDGNRMKLEALGYIVTTGSKYNKTYSCIQW